jgi:hypothetical protein
LHQLIWLRFGLDTVIHVRLPSSLADLARQQAARLETTISDHIRQLILDAEYGPRRRARRANG